MSSGSTRWISVVDAEALHRAAYRYIVAAAARAIEIRNSFQIVLAGGGTPRGTYRLLSHADTDWSRWQVYFGDERCLPPLDGERNSQMAAEVWLNLVPVPWNQVHAIPAELGAYAAAQAYQETLRGVGDFDLVLLGLGEDGHTASLFPGQEWGAELDAPDVIPVFDAPKPPSQRVSLSAARLSRSREALFMVEGESKRDAVRRWRSGADIPARAIRPRTGVDVLLEGGAFARDVDE